MFIKVTINCGNNVIIRADDISTITDHFGIKRIVLFKSGQALEVEEELDELLELLNK